MVIDRDVFPFFFGLDATNLASEIVRDEVADIAQ